MWNKIWKFLNSKPPEKYQLNILSVSQDSILIHKIISWVYEFTFSIVQFFEKVMLTTSVIFLKADEFWQLYETMIHLGIATLGIALMWTIILKLNNYNVDIEQMVARGFFFPIFVGVAPHLVVRFIIIFNKITVSIIDTESMMIPDKASLSTAIGMGLAVAVIGVLLLRLIFWYFKKIVLMIFYTSIIPIVLALRCMPQYHTVGDWLLGKMLSLLFTQIGHALVMAIMSGIILGVSEVSIVMSLGLQIGALAVMKDLEEIINEMLNCKTNLTNSSFRKQVDDSKNKYKKAKNRYKDVKRVFNKIKEVLN